jgi:hypothetical protein
VIALLAFSSYEIGYYLGNDEGDGNGRYAGRLDTLQQQLVATGVILRVSESI